MIEEMKEYAKENNVPIIMEESLEFIDNYIKENPIINILEIGTAIGYFACSIATNNNVVITTIERNSNMYTKAKENIKKMKLEDRVTLIHGDALNLKLFYKYDLIFIDAAMGQYIKLFDKFKNNLNPGGVIIADNMNFHGYVDKIDEIKSRNLKGLAVRTRRYRDYLEENIEFDSEILNVGDGIAISIRR